MVNIVRNFLIILNNMPEIRLKLFQKTGIQKTAEATVDLIGNKIDNRIMEVSKNSQQSNSKTVTNKHDK